MDPRTLQFLQNFFPLEIITHIDEYLIELCRKDNARKCVKIMEAVSINRYISVAIALVKKEILINGTLFGTYKDCQCQLHGDHNVYRTCDGVVSVNFFVRKLINLSLKMDSQTFQYLCTRIPREIARVIDNHLMTTYKKENAAKCAEIISGVEHNMTNAHFVSFNGAARMFFAGCGCGEVMMYKLVGGSVKSCTHALCGEYDWKEWAKKTNNILINNRLLRCTYTPKAVNIIFFHFTVTIRATVANTPNQNATTP